MLGPGAYCPEPTEGSTRPAALPKPPMVQHRCNCKHRPCPRCGQSRYGARVFTRTLHEVGDLIAGRPRDIALTYSQHSCCKGRQYFHADASALAPPKSQYTQRGSGLAIRLVVEDAFPSDAARGQLWRAHRGGVPYATRQTWGEAGGNKSGPTAGDPLPGWGVGHLCRLYRCRCTVRWPVLRAGQRR